ncbi:hypothetical protein REO53_000054 [Escherichia coli]|nr:hypothetical protein [Escherichia coli]
MNNQTMTFTPEQLRKQAQEMLRQAEQLEKTGVTKDAIRKDTLPGTYVALSGGPDIKFYNRGLVSLFVRVA